MSGGFDPYLKRPPGGAAAGTARPHQHRRARGLPHPLAFFDRGRDLASDRLFWASPSGLTLTGIGAAWTFEGEGINRFADARAAWRDCRDGALIENPGAENPTTGTGTAATGTGPILMGGFAFDPRRPSTARWAGYPTGSSFCPATC